MKLVDFELVGLLSSYGAVCSPRQQLPAIQSPAKNKFPTTGCLSTWQFNLYNKSDGDQSELQRTRLPKLHRPITDFVQLKARPNLAPTPADYIAFPSTVHKQLHVAALLHCRGINTTLIQTITNFKIRSNLTIHCNCPLPCRHAGIISHLHVAWNTIFCQNSPQSLSWDRIISFTEINKQHEDCRHTSGNTTIYSTKVLMFQQPTFIFLDLSHVPDRKQPILSFLC